MNDTDVLKSRAFQNAIGSLRLDVLLPLNVFNDSWFGFLFFESDKMFESEFVGVVRDLLKEESADVSCLINLGQTVRATYSSVDALFFDGSTSGDDYIAMLRKG